MNKYLRFAKLYFSVQLEYRAEFIFRRLRNLIGFATLFMIWLAVYSSGEQQLLGYSQDEMFTYLVIGQLVNAITWSNWTGHLQGLISNGDLSEFLLKPMSTTAYLVTNELSDKVLDVFFVCIELAILVFIFRPGLALDISVFNFVVFIMLIPLIAILRFLVSLAVSLTTFWYYQDSGWGQRFLFDMLFDFMSGLYFPLEFLPGIWAAVFIGLPTSLFYYTPMQIFLGKLSVQQSLTSLATAALWSLILMFICRLMWRSGLKNYGAFGR